MKIRINKALIYIFLVNVIVFPNGSVISKVLKLIFVTGVFFYLLKKKKIVWDSYLIWLFSFLGFAVISYTWAFSKLYAFNGIKTIALNTFCIFCFLELLYSDSSLQEGMLKSLYVFPIFRLVYLVLQYGPKVIFDVRGISGQHNSLGMFAALGAVYAIYDYFVFGVKKKSKLILCLIDLLICVISMSRKSVIYFMLPILITLLFYGKNFFIRMRNILFIMFFVTGSFYLVMHIPLLYKYIGKGIQSIIHYFMFGTGDSSAAGRYTRIIFGLKKFKERSYIGWGAMNYNYLFSNYEKNTSMVFADNNFIDVLVNFGFVGSLIYYSVYIISLVGAIKSKKKHTLKISMLLGVLLTLLVVDYGVSSYIYLHSQMFLAIVVYMLKVNEKRRNIV